MQRKGLFVVCLLLGLFATTATFSFGAPSASTIGPTQELSRRAYLPLTLQPTTARITFGTAVDNNNKPSPPLTTIPAGSRVLFYNVEVIAAQNKPFRIEYTLPTGPLPAETGTVSASPANFPGSICYTSNGSCNPPTSTLRPGVYTIKLFIEDQLAAEASATVAAELREQQSAAPPPPVHQRAR